jgi:hypothetical protein
MNHSYRWNLFGFKTESCRWPVTPNCFAVLFPEIRSNCVYMLSSPPIPELCSRVFIFIFHSTWWIKENSVAFLSDLKPDRPSYRPPSCASSWRSGPPIGGFSLSHPLWVNWRKASARCRPRTGGFSLGVWHGSSNFLSSTVRSFSLFCNQTKNKPV